LKTLLLEKEKLPRHKPCGGAITEQTRSLLDVDCGRVIENECFGVRFRYGRREVEVRTPFRITSFASREKFDMLLSDAAADAGAHLRDSECVRSIIPRNDSIRIKTEKGEYDAKAVVGADGTSSLIAAYVRRRFLPREVAFALESEVLSGTVDSIDPDVAQVYFGLVPSGYGWVFPKEDTLALGVACRLSDFKKPKDVFRGFLRRLGLDEDTPFHAHMIPDGSIRRPLVADRILLAGDAAGFADPFTGEGIAYAIKSGRLAAAALAEAHLSGDFSAAGLRGYEKNCFSSITRPLRMARRVSDAAFGHMDLFGRALTQNAPLLCKSLEVYANRISYPELLRWFLARLPYYYIDHIMHGNRSADENKGIGRLRPAADGS
jgi:geranylgeranyl reductase family protein